LDKQTRLFAFSILGILALGAHFFFLLAAIAFDFQNELDLPDADIPVVQQLDRYSYEYMHPLFTQNWFLFGPRPVSSNEAIEVKGYYYEDGRAEAQATEWIAIHDEIREGLQRNRFSHLNFFRNTFSQVIDPLHWDFQYEDSRMQLDRNDYTAGEEAQAFVPLERYGAYFLQKRYPGKPFAYMDARITITFPRELGSGQRMYPEETIAVQNLRFGPLKRGEDDARILP